MLLTNNNWKDEAIRLAEEDGYSWRKIARVLGKSKSTISDHLRRHFKGYIRPNQEVVSSYRHGDLSQKQTYNRVQSKPKILIYDVETAPLLGSLWGLWQDGIGLKQMVSDWHMMSVAAKWLNEDEVFYWDQRDVENIEDDYDLLMHIWDLLNECDVAIGHNLIKFDTKKLNARFILNGIPKPSHFRQIDTLRIAKEQFAFTSNSLEYLSERLCGVPKDHHAKFPGFTLWSECLKRNNEAWDTMEFYNKRDVETTEQLYNVLSSWSNKLPNFDVYVDDVLDMSVWEKNGYHYTNLGKYQKYRNKITGQEKRSRVNLLSKEKRASLLSNIV